MLRKMMQDSECCIAYVQKNLAQILDDFAFSLDTLEILAQFLVDECFVKLDPKSISTDVPTAKFGYYTYPVSNLATYFPAVNGKNQMKFRHANDSFIFRPSLAHIAIKIPAKVEYVTTIFIAAQCSTETYESQLQAYVHFSNEDPSGRSYPRCFDPDSNQLEDDWYGPIHMNKILYNSAASMNRIAVPFYIPKMIDARFMVLQIGLFPDSQRDTGSISMNILMLRGTLRDIDL